MFTRGEEECSGVSARGERRTSSFQLESSSILQQLESLVLLLVLITASLSQVVFFSSYISNFTFSISICAAADLNLKELSEKNW